MNNEETFETVETTATETATTYEVAASDSVGVNLETQTQESNGGGIIVKIISFLLGALAVAIPWATKEVKEKKAIKKAEKEAKEAELKEFEEFKKQKEAAAAEKAEKEKAEAEKTEETKETKVEDKKEDSKKK